MCRLQTHCMQTGLELLLLFNDTHECVSLNNKQSLRYLLIYVVCRYCITSIYV